MKEGTIPTSHNETKTFKEEGLPWHKQTVGDLLALDHDISGEGLKPYPFGQITSYGQGKCPRTLQSHGASGAEDNLFSELTTEIESFANSGRRSWVRTPQS